jgi:hypothetical protein
LKGTKIGGFVIAAARNTGNTRRIGEYKLDDYELYDDDGALISDSNSQDWFRDCEEQTIYLF